MSDEKSLAVLQQETRVWLEHPDRMSELRKVLTEGLTPEAFIGAVMTAHLRNPDLIPCTIQSKWLAIKEAAQLGLPIGGAADLCHLVPFGKVCTLMVDYKGLIQLAYRHPSRVLEIGADVVCENDECRVLRGNAPKIVHSYARAPQPRGEMVAAYAWAKIRGGGHPFVYLSAEEIEKHRKKSRPPNGMLWTEWPEAAWKKTAIKQLRKFIPMTPQLMAAIEAEDLPDDGRPMPPMPVPATASVTEMLDAIAGETT